MRSSFPIFSFHTFNLSPPGVPPNQALPPFNFLFSTGEHLKVTIRLSASTSRSPVSGILPLRSPLSFTQNFPKPLIRTSTPFSRVFLMISNMVSTALADSALDRSRRLTTDLVMTSLVRVMKAAYCNGLLWYPTGTEIWRNMHEILGLSQPVGVSTEDLLAPWDGLWSGYLR
jgi:hypothetical protein